MSIPISTLVPQVQNRLEEFSGPAGDGELWSIQYELNTALIEAMNDLMLLIGRPTQIVNQPMTLTANTPWQAMPTGILLLTNIRGVNGDLRKVSLHDMDYVQPGGTDSAWEQDISATGPQRWFPLGFNMFGVHPATAYGMPVTVTLTGIGYVTNEVYPYTGNEPVVFHDELFAAIESYATVYARTKEGGQELQNALQLYRDYLGAAQRDTMIEDRRDPVIFSPSFGGQSGLDPYVKR